MDGDFSQKLNSLLSDPAAVSRISAIANSLSGDRSEPASVPQEPEQTPTPPTVSADIGRDPRVALLYALKPLLREESRGKVDNLARAMAMASLFKNTRK